MIQLIMILALVVAVGAGVGSFALHERNAAVNAEREKVAAAQAKADKATQEATQAAADNIANMQGAYEAGEAKGKEIGAQYRAKGAGYVAANPAFKLAQCDIGPDLLRLINDSTRAMRTPTFASVDSPAMPSTGPTAGRQNADGNGGASGGSQSGGSVGAVHPPERSTDSAGQVPNAGMQPPPKPKPRAP